MLRQISRRRIKKGIIRSALDSFIGVAPVRGGITRNLMRLTFSQLLGKMEVGDVLNLLALCQAGPVCAGTSTELCVSSFFYRGSEYEMGIFPNLSIDQTAHLDGSQNSVGIMACGCLGAAV